MESYIERLSARFPTKAHGQRQQGGRTFTYVGIESTIGRLNEVFGVAYSTEILSVDIAGDFVILKGRISYRVDDEWYHKDGIGADAWKFLDRNGKECVDMDKALKTAYAEFVKKAGHQLGVGLYLWDDEIRSQVEAEMRGSPPSSPPVASSTPKPYQPPISNDGEYPTKYGLTEKQIKRIFGLGKEHNVTLAQIKSLMADNFGFASTSELNKDQYSALCDVLIPNFHADRVQDQDLEELPF